MFKKLFFKEKNKSVCPFLENVQVFSVKDGDTIVLRIKEYVTPNMFSSIKEHMESIYPNNIILILDGGSEISVMKKNE